MPIARAGGGHAGRVTLPDGECGADGGHAGRVPLPDGECGADGGHAGRVTLPVRKRIDHRGPLSIDVSSAWYFITLRAEGRRTWVGSRVPRDREERTMDFAAIADAMLSAARWYHEHGKWQLTLFLVMPDHLHFIARFPDVQVCHAGRVTLPMVTAIQNFKSYLSRACGICMQRDFFDTRLRDDAHYAEKFQYILGNPVRKGLCAATGEWPYSIAFNRESGNGAVETAYGIILPQIADVLEPNEK